MSATLYGIAAFADTLGASGVSFAPGCFAEAAEAVRRGTVPLLTEHQRDAPLGILTDLTEERQPDGRVAFLVTAEVDHRTRAAELARRVLEHEQGRGPLPGLSVGLARGADRQELAPGRMHVWNAGLRELSVTTRPHQPGAEVLLVTGAPAPWYPGPIRGGLRLAPAGDGDAFGAPTLFARLLARATPADRERLRAVGAEAVERLRDRIVVQRRPWSLEELDRLVAAELGLG